MDNQHKKIKGYRDLSQEEIDLMNEAKELAEKVGELVEKLESKALEDIRSDNPITAPNLHWVATGRIDLQKGFMSLIRSIAKPTTF